MEIDKPPVLRMVRLTILDKHESAVPANVGYASGERRFSKFVFN